MAASGKGGYALLALGPSSAANAQVMIGNPAAGWQAAVGIGGGTITVSSLTSTAASTQYAHRRRCLE